MSSPLPVVTDAAPGAAPEPSAPEPVDPEVLTERTRDAVALLEAIRDDRALLALVPHELRTQLMRVAGEVSRPSPYEKRELARAMRRKRRDDLRSADESVLARTGIRQKRAEQVFTTPLFRRVPVAAGADIDAALAEHTAPAALDAPAAEPESEVLEAQAAQAGEERTVQQPRTCYVCKTRFHELHPFYDSMCARCGDLNYAKRQQTADLTGRVALITGARVKIGYQASIMLLRAGARVIATTRFARDAAARYAREPDFADWGSRLSVFGLDLRHTPSVEAFARHLCATFERLDFILNNACQTVRRPPGFYAHLMRGEQTPFAQLAAPEQQALEGYEALRMAGRELRSGGAAPAPGVATELAREAGLRDPASLSQIALLDDDVHEHAQLFPAGQLDADLQQVDLRGRNSWRLALDEVPAIELLEVQLVNAVAPFILNARCKPLMLRVPTRDKHIVNVSAMEGQFYRAFKTDKHPHTNMAKAALNMLTRTAAADYVKDGIHMNSVDTGWVTDEDPAEIAARKTRIHGFHPPLDIVDGAARICDPIFDGFLTGKHVWGQFLKDYKPTDW